MDIFGFDAVARQIPFYRDQLLRVDEGVKEQAFDIRLKGGQPVCICGSEGVFFLKEEGGVTRALTDLLPRTSFARLQEIFLQICAHSVFSHEQEIKQGYVRVNSFYRAGICGTAVVENGKVKNIRDVTSIVFRIPREAVGCADRLFLRETDFDKGVLVAGAPSSGKTTFLRDIARSLSLGRFSPCRRVAVLDERGELGGAFDLGPCADILCGYPKSVGFETAIRSLSPEIVICDELSQDDLKTVRQAMFSGVALAASVHADRRDLAKRELCRALLKSGAFGTIVCLSGRGRPCEIESMERLEDWNEAFRGAADDGQRAASGDSESMGSGKKGTDAA